MRDVFRNPTLFRKLAHLLPSSTWLCPRGVPTLCINGWSRWSTTFRRLKDFKWGNFYKLYNHSILYVENECPFLLVCQKVGKTKEASSENIDRYFVYCSLNLSYFWLVILEGSWHSRNQLFRLATEWFLQLLLRRIQTFLMPCGECLLGMSFN